MILTCSGTDLTYERVGTTTTTKVTPGVDPGIGSDQFRRAAIAGGTTTQSSSSPQYGFRKSTASLSVAVEGSSVRVRRRVTDPWRELTDVVITADQIRAKTAGGLLGKDKLVIDRRTGEISFSSFTGACAKAAEGADSRKF